MATLIAGRSVLPELEMALKIQDFHLCGALYESYFIFCCYTFERDLDTVSDVSQVQHTS